MVGLGQRIRQQDVERAVQRTVQFRKPPRQNPARRLKLTGRCEHGRREYHTGRKLPPPAEIQAPDSNFQISNKFE
jgi:hypothetical protein